MRRIEYTREFLRRYRELGSGQRTLIEGAIRRLIGSDDPNSISHHLTRGQLRCNWSHRVKANLLVVFDISAQSMTFLSTGTHAQAYRLKK